ncbi:MAG TPA: glycosyltransferase family 4 protein [Casimicrobiaceae bacterium]|nr:glycosyltransferase family 4 protein [Casimicrobiaceae bacterium]
MSEPRAVLHISAAEGGGADRYIRDVAATVPGRHFLWHAGSGVDVIEDIGRQRFLPLSARVASTDATPVLREWLRAGGVSLVHVHGIGTACRERLALVQAASPLPWLVTLHDLTFVNQHAFSLRVLKPDAAWIREIEPTLSNAAAVLAPSAFVRDIAAKHFPGIRCEIIAPGIDIEHVSAEAAVPRGFAEQAPERRVAVVGAIGPHKGSAPLAALVDHLNGSGIGVIVIGYTDSQLRRGWSVPGRYYVHGPYVDGELPALLASYAVDVALFPNRLPESFSYTLSEVWAAGVPVIVPEDGALFERVATHGGGWLLTSPFSVKQAAALLRRLLAPEGAPERGRVKSHIDRRDAARIPTLAAMARDIDALYRRFGLPPPSADAAPSAGDDALRSLLAANLNGFVFRKELSALAEEASLLGTALEEAKPWVAKLERDVREAQAWARKLEHDIDVLKAEGESLFKQNRRLLDDKAAFDQLPPIVRKLLLKKAFRARR